jgi:hypothetical protein
VSSVFARMQSQIALDAIRSRLLKEKLRDKNGGKFTKKKFKQHPLIPGCMKPDKEIPATAKFYL